MIFRGKPIRSMSREELEDTCIQLMDMVMETSVTKARVDKVQSRRYPKKQNFWRKVALVLFS
jgi:hypothetical protein